MSEILINMSWFHTYKVITFNQSLLFLNGIPLGMDKFEDEKLARLFKPSKKATENIREILEYRDKDIERIKQDPSLSKRYNLSVYDDLAKIDQKLYADRIKMYNILVTVYSDATPTVPTIPSKDFTKWAVDEGFIKRTINQKIAKKLYKPLKGAGLIDGEFNEKWKWLPARNQLPYLAKRLKQIRILGDNCHLELSNYIQDPNPDTKKPLKNIKDPSDKSKTVIDNIVKQLTE